MLALFGVSFLTPLDSLFALAAAVPLAALALAERRAARVRRALALEAPGRRTLALVAGALVLLPALVAVAAAQPVVVRQRLVSERADAQAYFVFDTSLSMQAAARPDDPTRLARAKRLALRLRAAIPDVPVGIVSMTDRSLPNLMPTTDPSLFTRTLEQSVAIDSPPPSQVYKGRATTFVALVSLVESHYFAKGVQRRLVVVFTDGEATAISPLVHLSLYRKVTPLFVHVWAPGERIWTHSRPDPRYAADPSSSLAIAELAAASGGRAYDEQSVPDIVHALRSATGAGGTQTKISAYARVALAPWILLGGVLPLGFLLWRRNL